MKSVAIDEFGQSASVHEVPKPEPLRGEVLVRVFAAGVNPVDWKVADGWMKDATDFHFPLILGFDLAGIVERCGEGVDTMHVGDRVFGSTGKLDRGSYAEYAVAPASLLAPMPQSLSFEQAAAVPIPGHTAMQAIDELDLHSGEVILIVGASGGVGSYAIEMAARRGCTVLATALADDVEFERWLGATDTIDYTNLDTVAAVRVRYPDGIDAILDVVSDPAGIQPIAGLLRGGGRIVSTIGSADESALAKRGITATNMVNRITREGLERLAQMFDSAELKNPMQQTFPLDHAPDAIAQSKFGHVRGKLVLTV